MGRLALSGAFLLLAVPARPEPPAAPERLCAEAGKEPGCLSIKKRPTAALPEQNQCPEDWNSRRRGGCWTKTPLFNGQVAWGYIHPRGWAVDSRCFSDKRFTQADILAALETAWRKMSPSVPASTGGCLADFNPGWGKELAAKVWDNHMHVNCPAFDVQSNVCADHERRDHYEEGADGRLLRHEGYYRLLTLRNVERCMRGGSGLAGVLFHETLHGADADNFSTEKHNEAWSLPQFEWIRDRVYGTEAVCFFATDPAQRRFVNVLQCHSVIRHDAQRPREDLCREFGASFTDLRPQGFIKH